jgi:hypoxanthine phosphoribosyltransferase
MKTWNFIKKVLFTEEQVEIAINHVSKEIHAHYVSVLGGIEVDDIQIVTVLNGGREITQQLMKRLAFINSPLNILSSSYSGLKPMESISVQFQGPPILSMEDVIGDKHILIIDDILDSGRTLDAVKKEVEKYKPRDIQCCVMISRNRKRSFKIEPKFVALNINGRDFVVGCGLDLNGHFRNLPYIASVKTKKDKVWDPDTQRTFPIVICNKCGEMCSVTDSDSLLVDEPYGLIGATVDGGYYSKCMEDGTSYTFDLCEECVMELIYDFKIRPEIHGLL